MFERVNLKTHLDLLPDLSPIPKSAYGCCRYHTVIESFTETNQTNVYQDIPFNTRILLPWFSSWGHSQRGQCRGLLIAVVNSWHGQHGKTLQRLNILSLHLQSKLLPDQVIKEWCDPHKAAREGLYHFSAPCPKRSDTGPNSKPQKISSLFPFFHLFLWQQIT